MNTTHTRVASLLTVQLNARGLELWSYTNLLLFHAAPLLLSYVVEGISVPKLCVFQRSTTIHHCMTL